MLFRGREIRVLYLTWDKIAHESKSQIPKTKVCSAILPGIRELNLEIWDFMNENMYPVCSILVVDLFV